MAKRAEPDPRPSVLDQLRSGTAPDGLRLPGRWDLSQSQFPGPVRLPPHVTADALNLTYHQLRGYMKKYKLLDSQQ